MMFPIYVGDKTFKIKMDCLATVIAVANHFDMAIFRDTTSFKVGSEWKGKRIMSYWCNRLVEMGFLEAKTQKRGWYTWTMYRSLVPSEQIMSKFGDIPF